MLINRRELIKTTALGTTSLALTPSFNNLLATPANATPSGVPHRLSSSANRTGTSLSNLPCHLFPLKKPSWTKRSAPLKLHSTNMNCPSGCVGSMLTSRT